MTAELKEIWKFPVPVVDVFQIVMPKGAAILSVQVQHGAVQLWALVSPDAQNDRRMFRLIGTGHPIIDSSAVGTFIGTVQLDGGNFVFHLFEVKP